MSQNGGALIIADDIGVFLAIARSLGRGGIDVGIATSEEDYPGLYSRYVNRVHRVPGYLNAPSDWIEAIAALIERHNYRLVIPTNDSSLTNLAAGAQRLGRHRLAIPNPEALETLADKGSTKALAQKLAIPVAKGRTVTSATRPADLEKALDYPFVLKPAAPYAAGDIMAKTSATIVRSSDDLAAALAGYGDRDLLAEGFFAGDGVGLSVLCDRGQVRMMSQHRRLAEVSETGRSSVRILEDPDAGLQDAVKKLCAATQLIGIAMFEFRRRRADGEFILIEVNPRFWGSLPLAIAGGADFPMALWQMAIGNQDSNVRKTSAAGVEKSDLSGEYDRLTLLIRSHRGTRRIKAAGGLLRLAVRALIAPGRFDSYARDDRTPFRAERRKLIGYLAKAAQRRMFSERSLKRE